MVLEGSQQITQITQIIFLPMEIIFANGEHEEHEIFFSQQIAQITQKINFVLFVLSVGKRKKIRVICAIC